VKGRVVPAPATFHVVVTCEHAAAAIPRKFGDLGLPAAVRASHRAYDAGALGIAKAIAKALQAPLHVGAWSRLVVDLNRSHDQPAVIPRRVDGRPIAGNQVDGLARKQRVLEYWMPYRMAATADIAAASHRGVVLHLSVHSFTPTLRGVVRRNDIGLLHDPERALEVAFCNQLRSPLVEAGLVVRRNFPYFGNTDGFTSHLRQRLPAGRYLGIEIECNQRLVGKAPGARRAARALVDALRRVVSPVAW
jgi:predicted N-formylglutamate amidohydrolase